MSGIAERDTGTVLQAASGGPDSGGNLSQLHVWKQELGLEGYSNKYLDDHCGFLSRHLEIARDVAAKGRTIEALEVLGEYLADRIRDNGVFNGQTYRYAAPWAMMKILHILWARRGPPEGTIVPESYITFLETEAVPQLETEDTDALLVFVPLYLRIVLFLLEYQKPKTRGKQLETQVLETLGRREGSPNDKEMRRLSEYMTEFYTGRKQYQLRYSNDIPPYARSLMRRHVAHLQASHRPSDRASLARFYKLSRFLAAYGMCDEAESLLLQVFDNWTVGLRDSHTESDAVVRAAIRALCRSSKYLPSGPTEVNALGPFNLGLIISCLENELYREVEALISERLQTVGMDAVFRSFVGRVLDYHGAPRFSRFINSDDRLCWKDRRLYLRRWVDVTLVSVPATDQLAFPEAPAQFVLGDGGSIHIKMSRRANQDFHRRYGSETDAVAMLRHTVLWKYLELLHANGRAQATLLAVGQETPNNEPPTVWVFPSEQIGVAPVKDIATTVSSPYPLDQWTVGLVGGSRKQFVVKGPPGSGTSRSFLLEGMRYSIKELNSRDIHPSIPFITYEDFQTTRAWRDGFTYREYMQTLLQSFCFKHPSLERVYEKVCTDANGKERLPLWQLPGEKDNDGASLPGLIITGLFNGVPSGPCLVDTEDPPPGNGRHNLVSASWSDWVQFTLYQDAPEQMPRLIFGNGQAVKCYGYIMGCWTSDDLSRQWTGLKMYVVDAEIGCQGGGSAGEHCNFLLSAESLGNSNVRDLHTFDKLRLCGGLNPCLFEYTPPSGRVGAPASVKQLETGGDSTMDEDLYKEMNRREAWDRDWERRSKPYPKDNKWCERERQTLDDERMRESQARLAWDEQYRNKQLQDALKQLSVVNTLTKPPPIMAKTRRDGFLKRYRLRIHTPGTAS